MGQVKIKPDFFYITARYDSKRIGHDLSLLKKRVQEEICSHCFFGEEVHDEA